MNKIHQLDQNTINQIAAGEVIDRPSSIVKELVENSIDAGSTMITVEIKDGGTSLIRITDNGSGIYPDDIKTAFLRHATSKITNALDLVSVSSLGFRGEALSSIAAVCQVELITKVQEEITGIRYKIEGGKEILFEEIGAPEGTTFIVRNIFFNTPARRKFLKANQTEAGYISDIIEKIALSHPDISFNFIVNGQNKIHTSGNGNLKDVIYAIYGKDVTDNIIEINCENDFVKIAGYIGKAIVSRGNRTCENYFINGRYIKSNILNKSIEEGYKFILMQHKYPFTVLNFSIDPELIDVNVHPSKMELRFRCGEELFSFVRDNINSALLEKPNIIKVDLEEEKKEVIKTPKMPEPFEVKRSTIDNKTDLSKIGYSLSKTFGESNDTYNEEPILDNNNELISDNVTTDINTEIQSELKSEPKPVQQEITEVYDDFISEVARPKHKIIGQVFETYWIIEYDEKMYIIDQHAAHEKVMFEKLMDKMKNKAISSQMINPPVILNLSMNEAALLEKYLKNFKDIGFEIECFGGQDYAVRAIPADLYGLDNEEVLMGIIDNLSNENGRMVPDIIDEKIASMSCKAAVKGNTVMSLAEANALIEQLLSLENPFNCPHGRPTIISMSKYELDKKFKRIV